MATPKMVLLSISSLRISKRPICGNVIPQSHQSVVAFASLRLCRTRFALTVSHGCATRSPSGRSVVRAAGLEPAQRLLTEGFSYLLRLSPPKPRTFVHGPVWGLDYTFTITRLRRRCCPSSLYTFPDKYVLRAW